MKTRAPTFFVVASLVAAVAWADPTDDFIGAQDGQAAEHPGHRGGCRQGRQDRQGPRATVSQTSRTKTAVSAETVFKIGSVANSSSRRSHAAGPGRAARSGRHGSNTFRRRPRRGKTSRLALALAHRGPFAPRTRLQSQRGSGRRGSDLFVYLFPLGFTRERSRMQLGCFTILAGIIAWVTGRPWSEFIGTACSLGGDVPTRTTTQQPSPTARSVIPTTTT